MLEQVMVLIEVSFLFIIIFLLKKKHVEEPTNMIVFVFFGKKKTKKGKMVVGFGTLITLQVSAVHTLLFFDFIWCICGSIL